MYMLIGLVELDEYTLMKGRIANPDDEGAIYIFIYIYMYIYMYI
jgi:hypothetical protein